LSFPAKAGIQFLLCFGSSFRRLSTAEWLVKPESSAFAFDLAGGRIPSFFRSHPCERVTFLCLHKEK